MEISGAGGTCARPGMCGREPNSVLGGHRGQARPRTPASPADRTAARPGRARQPRRPGSSQALSMCSMHPVAGHAPGSGSWRAPAPRRPRRPRPRRCDGARRVAAAAAGRARPCTASCNAAHACVAARAAGGTRRHSAHACARRRRRRRRAGADLRARPRGGIATGGGDFACANRWQGGGARRMRCLFVYIECLTRSDRWHARRRLRWPCGTGRPPATATATATAAHPPPPGPPARGFSGDCSNARDAARPSSGRELPFRARTPLLLQRLNARG